MNRKLLKNENERTSAPLNSSKTEDLIPVFFWRYCTNF